MYLYLISSDTGEPPSTSTSSDIGDSRGYLYLTSSDTGEPTCIISSPLVESHQVPLPHL